MTSVSIIIPIYNVASYIDRCIDSILLQDCDDVQIECILVNDCTPDESMTIVNEKLKNYCGNISFVLVNHFENQGLSVARNTGLKVAKSEFVLFVDSDDRLMPHAVKYLIGEVNDDKVDVVMGNSFVCNRETVANSLKNEIPLLIDNKDEKGLRMLLSQDLFHTAWNKIIRREFLINHHILFEKGLVEEDFLWSYLVFLYARKIIVKPNVTYIYENNPMSITNTQNQKNSLTIESRIIICSHIMNTPTKYSKLECNMYIFYILLRAVNLFEHNKSQVAYLWDDLHKVRNRFIKGVIRDGYLIQFLFFLTSVKPFYYICTIRWYRRYYNKIASMVLTFSRLFIWRRYMVKV